MPNLTPERLILVRVLSDPIEAAYQIQLDQAMKRCLGSRGERGMPNPPLNGSSIARERSRELLRGGIFVTNWGGLGRGELVAGMMVEPPIFF